MEHLDHLATKRLQWHMALSVEDRAKVVAMHGEEGKEERAQVFVATFTAADTNSDGLLDKAELKDFFGKMGANAEAASVPHMKESDTTEEDQEKIYALFNAATPGVEGISMQDFGTTMEIFKAKMAEMRAAM